MIPEIETGALALGSNRVVRIPPELDVPLSARVRRLLDSAALRHLSRITQLGLVSLVFPGASHRRLEHSLGVYRNALLVLQTLCRQTAFQQQVDDIGLQTLLVAALLHDVGHWPYAHAIEDMRLPGVPRHEARVQELVNGPELTRCLQEDWSCRADDIMAVLSGRRVGTCQLSDQAIALLASCLSGPIDIDKLDYLHRDSLHAGVPYGRNFDSARLIASLVVHPEKPCLAISEKGRTAAEMMVFARYVMFSEVYWHHAVRSATAMLQRALFELRDRFDLANSFLWDEPLWGAKLLEAATQTPAEPLVAGLFGPTRVLYKRAKEFNRLESPRLYDQLAHRPYWWLVACSEALAQRCWDQASSSDRSQLAGGAPSGSMLLIDAAPVKLEVDINIDVVTRNGRTLKLAEISPVADSLARRQFDAIVKRVRVFVPSDWREPMRDYLQSDELLQQAIDQVNAQVV